MTTRAALLRGATAGTLAALALAVVLLVLAPAGPTASRSAVDAVNRRLAGDGITVVEPPTVDESVFANPGHAAAVAGSALLAGLAAGLAVAALDRRAGRWWLWLSLGAAVTAVGALAAGGVSARSAGAWAAFWSVLALSWWWSGRSTAPSPVRP